MNKKLKDISFIITLIILPIIFFLVSLMLGPYKIGPFDVINIIIGKIIGRDLVNNKLAINMIWTVRMPRILGVVLAGSGLSAAGAVFQGLFKNPLASPYTLGISHGAGFGAAIAILLSTSALTSSFPIQISALIFGLVAVSVTFLMGMRGRKSTVTLVLSGMLVGSLFSSLVALIKYVADPYEKLPEIVFWLMGTLSAVTYQKLWMILPLFTISMAIIFMMRWRINVLTLGDQEAKSYGINVKKEH